MAGVMELLVFAVVDPQNLNWFGQPFEMSRQTIYTLSFFVFWLVISVAGALTVILSLSSTEVNQPQA
jgi:hypothetical protein